IDQCVAQGVPFAREYGGLLDNRSFGGAQVSRTFYARGQTGQQLLLGAYSALNRQIHKGKVKMYTRHEMLDVVKIDGHAKGIVTRNLKTGEIDTHEGHAVLLCTGGYSNVFYLSTNAIGSNVTAAWRAHKRGAYFSNPCYTQIHPTCIPVTGDHQSKLTLMSESLRNDGRVWAPKTVEVAEKLRKKEITADQVAEDDRDYFLERKYPAFGNLVPRDVASRNAKEMVDDGKGVGGSGFAVFLDFADAIKRLGEDTVRAKYGNLFDMYIQITDENPYKQPMRIYPAVHYTMGGLWVDYNLSTNIPGLYALGECNFSDHGANRLGASALMQGLADGYFVIPYTLGDYLATTAPKPVDKNHPSFEQTKQDVIAYVNKLLALKGNKTVNEYHRDLGHIMWEYCGMARTDEGLRKAKGLIQALKADFWQNAIVSGENEEINASLERAGRVADFIELGELMVTDALMRRESCGGHFRLESQTEEGEALRDDENFAFVAAWEFKGENVEEELHKEDLIFENVKLAQRNYK
ncbi:MAG: succinate dehydrogenase (quinone) flavoprotein subunit, partial [Sphingobacteriales bacterium]